MKSITEIIRGLREDEMPIRHLITLCQYYNVSADYILGTKPDSRRNSSKK